MPKLWSVKLRLSSQDTIQEGLAAAPRLPTSATSHASAGMNTAETAVGSYRAAQSGIGIGSPRPNARSFGCHNCDSCNRDCQLRFCGACCFGCTSSAAYYTLFGRVKPPSSPPLSPSPSPLETRRLAHIISKTAARFNRAARALQHAGFVPQWFQPVSTEDPKVAKWEENDTPIATGPGWACAGRNISHPVPPSALAVVPNFT